MQEAQIASDYRGRLAYELLQNADDAMEGAASQRDHVKFLLKDDALWMANNGRPLSDTDIQGLCGLGASSKIDARGTKRASIGHKGLGFKSVLEITERPAAMSDGIGFDLSEDIARGHISRLFDELALDVPRSLPVMRFPALLSDELDEWLSLQELGFTTAFRFPFRSEMTLESRGRLAENLLGLPLTTVLFLKHLDQIDIEVATEHRSDARSWQVTREVLAGDTWRPAPGLTTSGMYRVEVLSSDGDAGRFLLAHNGDVEIGDHRAGLSGPAWEGVTVSEVSAAVLEPTGSVVEMPKEWRRFHVFLPTAEPSPYPILVNGAFTTDLSRQALRVNEDDDEDYNRHLIKQAAALFVNQVLPNLVYQGMDHVLAALDRDTELGESPTARALHQAMVAEVSQVPLLPTETGDRLPLNTAVFPPASLDEDGAEYRRLMVDGAAWDGRRFPAPSVCSGRWSRVGSDHGAMVLEAADALSALAGQLDPGVAVAVEHDSGGFELDPVLEICSAIYLSAPRDEHPEIRKRARSERLFPTLLNPDRTFERVSLEGETAFYPPRSAKHALPLSGLQFMSHSICWGALLPNERTEFLGHRLNTWSLLFEVQEFRFEVVMREAVLPHLRIRGRGQDEAGREELANMDTLIAICQLAGRFPKPDRPLRYQRLSSDRGLFNLSRLPLPCRGTSDAPVDWIPAYRAYFGKDWIGEGSVETLSDALRVADATHDLKVPFLLPPEEFLGRLEDLSQEDEAIAGDLEADADEVELDEDFDSRLESDEFSAWMSFLKWIGVNAAMRPVHFHDVEDLESGWLTTKDLSQPKGWAFVDLGEVWEDYRSRLIEGDARLSDQEYVPYFYELHDLEGLITVLGAAERNPSGEIGRALFEHVARHWETLEQFSELTVALVKKGLYPSQRAKPPKAKSEEIAHVGDNFWIHRLRTHSFFPTSHGPRRPDQTWLMSDDIGRRFGRRGQTAEDMVPVFQFERDLPERQVRAVCTRLGVRSALTPATFTLEDARLLCRRLAGLFGAKPISDAHLREIIRPAYRELFELLSGRSADGSNRGSLREEPLLVELGGEYNFRPAHQVLYSSTPGFLQRSGLQNQIPTFVIESEPSANAPLAQLFEVRSLENSIDWLPDPGETPFDEDEHASFMKGLEELAPLLLARVRVERTRLQDGGILKGFVDRAEPVSELGLRCRLDGRSYSLDNSREYYVRGETGGAPLQVFIVWGDRPWPPNPDEGQRLAMALADALEVNLVEAFLALIQSERGQQRRLLEMSGATRFLEDARIELESPDAPRIEGVPDADGTEGSLTTSPLDEPTEEQAADIDTHREPAPPPVELVNFEDLWIEGEPILIFGETSDQSDSHDPIERSSRGGNGDTTRAAPGVDLVTLDSLGMRITAAYEVNRLRKLNKDDVVVLPGSFSDVLAADLIIDVSTPRAIRRARSQSGVAKELLDALQVRGISQLHPGFDILTIVDGKADRLIELKSSAVDARVQSMTWNEWKSARDSGIREKYWLYLVGNLRADILAPPYLRAIRDPFGSLYSEEISEERASRAVQLRVREFDQAEHLFLVRELELPEGN